MLASPARPGEVRADDRLEVKYDGFRALAALAGGRVALQSRNGLDLASRFPGVIAALTRFGSSTAVIDGELVAGAGRGGRFQALGGAPTDVRYAIFDLLWLGERDLRPLPLEERLASLGELVGGEGRGRAKEGHGAGRAGRTRGGEVVTLAEAVSQPLPEALARARAEGWEGVVAKRAGSAYAGGRSRAWLKVKVLGRQELAVVGYTPISSGAAGVGALLVASFEGGRFVYAGKVGTGFDEPTRRALLRELEPDRAVAPSAEGAPRLKDARWVTPRLVAQVAFTEWTAEGRLRHPSFQGLRPDKRPEETARE